jgi:hypothetical protein
VRACECVCVCVCARARWSCPLYYILFVIFFVFIEGNLPLLFIGGMLFGDARVLERLLLQGSSVFLF